MDFQSYWSLRPYLVLYFKEFYTILVTDHCMGVKVTA